MMNSEQYHQLRYLTLNIIRETIKVEKKEMDKDRILTHSRVNGTLRK